MRITITGASGVLGKSMVTLLSARGDAELILTDLVRDKLYFDDSLGKFYPTDITGSDLPVELFEGVDAIVHCASAAPSYTEEAIRAIVIDGTKTLLERALRAGVKRFIYISSTAVYGIPESVPVTESAELQDYHDPYNRAKIAAEKICQQYRNLGLCIPILRPRTFLGPGRMGTFSMLNQWASEGRGFPLLGKGKNRYQFLDVEDLCEAICLCLEKPESVVNDTFNIGAKEFDTILEDYQSVLDAAGYGKKIRRIPATPALIALRVLEKLKVMPLYKRLYEKMVIDYYVSVEKAEKQLGFKPKYSNRDTLTRCYQWYVENAQEFKNKSGSANSVPWKQGVLGYVKYLF